MNLGEGSYLTWFLWYGPDTRLCAHASVGELTQMQVTSFRRVSWQVSSWQVVGLEMEARAETGCKVNFPPQCPPLQGLILLLEKKPRYGPCTAVLFP